MTEGDAVRVCVRVRPLIQREQGDQVNLFWKTEKSTISQVDGTKSFNFDRVFHSNETSDQVYQEMAVPILQSVLHGYHGTIFAYGQTSSGKTYTMMGTANSIGIIPQAVQDTFKIIQEIRNREFLLRVSYMEIYNETVTDLLCDDRKKKPLEVREDLDRTVYVADLTEEIVMVPDQVMKWIKKGEKNRHYGETKMNEHSSRSHTIFRMIIESRERSDPGNSENCDGAVMVSHLNLVDLAGSERASQTGAEGVRLKEGCNINRSLFILGQVIKKLSDGQAGGFINYRDSKLTRILQNSLGGNTKTLIICTVTPVSFDETLSTLQFASTAKHVRNTPHVNEVVDDQALLKRYRKEILDLKKQLEQLEATSGVRTHAMAKEEHAQLLAEIQQLQNERENRIWNLTSIIIAPSQESEKDQKAKRKRRVTWAPGKLKNSLGSSCFSDFDIPSKTSNFIKKRKFSDLPLLTEVDDSICTEVSDFDETAPELDLNPMGKVSIRAKKTAAFCQSMIEFDSEDPFLGSNQFNDFSQQKSKEMEQKITDLESQLKKITQEYESDAKEKESFVNEIASLKEKLQLKEEETNNIVKALELQITNLEGQLHTVGTRETVNKCSVDIKELHSEKGEIQGGKMAALEEIQTLLGNHVVEQEIIAEKFPSDPHHLCQEHIQMLEQKILDLEQTIETLGMQLKQDENAEYHKEDFMESIQLCEALMTEKGNALEEMNTMRNNYDSVILENESLKREIKGLEQQLNEKNDTKEFEVLEKEMQKEHEAQLMHEIVSLKKVVENAEVYNQDLEADLETKSNILKDQNKQIHELKKTVDVLQKKVRNLDLSSSMGDSDKLCEEVFQLKQSLADAEAVTRDAQKESAFLKSENRELNEKMDHLSIHSQQREKDASTYEKQLEAEKAKFKNMQADLQKELQYSFNEINNLNGLMAGKVPKDLLARVELEKEIQNYSKQLAEITEEKCVLETEVASLSEYKSLPNEIEHLKTQLCQATEELRLLKQEQSLFSKKDNTIQEQSNQINRLTEEVAEVQAKFHETEEQFAELKKAHKELEEQYLSSSETLILKQNESECLAKEREELQCAINCMEIQLSTTLKELDQAVKDKGGLLHEQDIFVKNQQVAHTVMEEKSSQFTIPLHNLDEVKSLVTEKDAVLKSVEKERDHLQEQVNNLCSQVELLQEQTNELHKGEEMYKQQQSRMKLEVEQLQICLKEARVSLDVTQEEKLEVFQKLECIEKDLVLVDQQRRELLSSLENIKAERDDLRRDLNENIELSIENQDELRSSLQELKEHKMLVGELRAQLQDTATSIPFNLKGQQASVLEDKLYDDKLALETAHYNLTREADILREQIKVLEQAREEFENKLPSLEEQLCFVTNERDDARNMQESLEKERDVLKAELESKIKEIQRLTGELNVLSECNQLSNGDVNLQKLHEKLLAVDQEKSELYEILENVRAEKDQLKIELQENTETSVVTQEELSSALEELKTKAKLLDDMKSQLCVQENLTENLEKDLKHEIFQLEENLNVLTNDRDKLAAELTAAVDKKLELDGFVSALTGEIHALQEKSIDSSKMSALAEKLQDNEAKYQELSSKKDALEAAHQSLICELEQVKAAEVADQENAKDLQKPCALTEQQTITCQVDEVKSMDESLEGEINIVVEKNEVLSLKEELEQTRAENTLDELQDQARLQSEVENLLLKLDETQSTIEYLQSEKKETEQALGDLQSQMEAITLERDELKVTETSLMSERDKLNRSLQENNEMIAHLKNELQKKAMDEQQMVQEKHDDTQERLTDEVEELRKNMNDTASTLQILQLDKAEMELKLLTVQQLMETLVKERDDLKIIQENLISEKDQLLGNLKEYMDKVDHIQTNVTQASANEQETVLKSKLELSREGSTDDMERLVRTINDETTLLNVAKDKLETQKNLLDLQQQIDLLTQERDELKLKQECLKSERDQLKADLKEQMDLLLQKKSESQQMAHEKQELELAHQRLKDELEQVMRNMTEANASLQTLQQDRLDMEQRLLSLHEQMEIKTQERDELKLKQDSFQKDAEMNAYLGEECQETSIEDQRMVQEKTMEPYQSCRDEVEQIMKNLNDLEALHKDKLKTEQELLNLQQQLETLTHDRDGLRISHEHLTSERDQMKQNLKETMDMVVNIKNELLQKAAEGQQMEQEKQELELAHQRLKDESEQLMKNMTDTEEKLQALQKNKCESDQQLLNLQQQMEILVQERDDMKSAQDCMISERNQLNEDLEKQTQLLLNSKNEQKVAEDQMTANGKLIDEVQQRCKNEVEQITRKLKETEANVNALKEDELEIKQTLCNLKQQIENLTQERDEVMVTQENLISERDQLKEDLKENVEMAIETQDDLRKAQDEVQHHKHKVHQMASQISLLEEKLAIVEKQVAEKETLLSETLSTKDLLNHSKQEQDLKVEQLNQALESSECTLQQVMHEKNEALLNKQSLAEKIESMSEERCQLQQVKETLQEEVMKLNEDLELLKHQHDLLETLHSDESKQLKEQICQVEQLKGMLQQNDCRALQLEDEKDSLQKQIQEQDVKISSLNLEQDQFQQLLQRVRSEKESIYSELQTQEKLSSQLREELNKCHADLQATGNQKEAETGQTSAKLDELSRQIKSLQQEIEQLQQTINKERIQNHELRDEIEHKDKDILLLNLKLSLPPEEEVDELEERIDSFKNKTQEMMDILVKISGIYSDQYNLIDNLSSEMQNEAETSKTAMSRLKDFLSHTQSRSFRTLQTEHTKIHLQLKTVIHKFKEVCMTAAVKEEQYSLIKDCEEELIAEQKKHDEIELQIQCLEQYGTKWTDSAAEDLKFYELEFLSKMICKKCDFIKHVEDFSEIQEVLSSTESALQDEVKRERSFYMWLNEFSSPNFNVTELNEGVQQENRRIIGMIQLMTNKLKAIIPSKTQRAVSEYLKQMQTELEMTKEKYSRLSKKLQHVAPSGNTSALEEENVRLRENIRGLQADLKKMQSRIKILEEQLNASRAETKQKEEKVAYLQSNLLLNTAETELVKIRAQLTEKESSLQSLRTEIEDLQNTIAKGAKPYREEIDNLKTQLVKSDMEKMKRSKTMDQEIASLKSCIEDKEECLRKLKEQLRRTQKDCDTSVCSDKEHPVSSNFPLTCGGGSGIAQSTAMLVLQSKNAKLEKQLSFYKKRYSQHSNTTFREDKKTTVSETPASHITAHPSHTTQSLSKTEPETVDQVSPTKSDFPSLYLASPGKTGRQWKRPAPTYMAQTNKRAPLSPSKSARHSMATASPSKMGMHPKSVKSPNRASVPVPNVLTASPCKNQNSQTLELPQSKFFDVRSKSMPYCPTQFFDNSMLGSLPDVKNLESAAEKDTAAWWYEKKETANECKTS